jgi:predicted DCC family thiol-disulfide oxidoreductase YuxK
VAKHRYRMFGRTKECQIPSNEIRDRFLGWLWRSLSS